MKILNFGSMNLDYVYQVERFVQAGETLGSLRLEKNCGGKGLNQSIALARAGVEVCHAGMVGEGGNILKKALQDNSVDVSSLRDCDELAGHAIIQVNRDGQNCILLYSGSNYAISQEYINEVLGHFESGDLVLLQNETNNVAYIMQKAAEKGLGVAFNPSPISAEIKDYPLECVGWFILNEIEGKALTGEIEPQSIVQELLKRYPNAAVVLTLGEKGGLYADRHITEKFPVFSVDVEDTTAAGDTFTGFFLAGIIKKLPIRDILRQASAASALAVSRKGAAASIPSLAETVRFLQSFQ
jgi:ribokinase